MGEAVHRQPTSPGCTPTATRYVTPASGHDARPERNDDPGRDAAHRHLAAAEDPDVDPRRRLHHLIDVAAHVDDAMGATAPASRRLFADAPSPRSDALGELRQLATRAATCFGEQVRPALTRAGVHLVGWSQLTPAERTDLGRYFDRQVLPLLVPMACDPTHPFPHISDRSLNLAVVVAGQASQQPRFARIKIPTLVPRLVPVPADQRGGARYIAVEDMVAARLDRVFQGVPVVEQHSFRVTWGRVSRAAGRSRPAPTGRHCPVRLEVSGRITDWVLNLLNHHLGTVSHTVWRLPEPLDLTSLRHLAGATPRDGRPTDGPVAPGRHRPQPHPATRPG